MHRNLVIIFVIFSGLAIGAGVVPAQITLKLPDIKIKKPDTSKIKNNEIKNNETNETTKVKTNNTNSKLIFPWTGPTNVPVFLKNKLVVSTVVQDEYWKMKGQSDFSSWIPKMRFENFYNEEKVLSYGVEWFNPDGSPWFGEQLGSSGRNAERTVVYESPSAFGNGVFDTKSTNGTGVYGFRITNLDTKEVLIQGKFKVGKFSRSYSERDKNKADFYVDQDWIMPYATIGFHHAFDQAGAIPILASLWLKGDLDVQDLEGRVFYKGRQIASTKDEDGGGVGIVEERNSGFAAAFQQADKIWKRYELQWSNFRMDGNGSYNPENFPRAHFADKNPGEYTIKVYRNGAQVRELTFTVGADGRFVTPGYSNQIPLPYYRFVVPVKFVGTGEKWNAAAWKTDSFYGNPLSGFAVQ